MRPLRAFVILFGAAPLLSACLSSGAPIIVPDASASRPSAPESSSVPRQVEPAPRTTPPGTPRLMRDAGLEGVIGAAAAELQRQFGDPRIDVREGDARKLQFTGEACVLDVFLYPTRNGATPTATHVEARRASDGRNVDRAACVRALRRR